MKKISLNYVRKILPIRSKVSSKIDGGMVLIISGSKGLFGAGILAALAATKSGAGYTYLMTDIKNYPWLRFPDFIVHSFSVAKLREHKSSVIGIGPGLGINDSSKKLLAFLLKNKFQKVVVDEEQDQFIYHSLRVNRPLTRFRILYLHLWKRLLLL